MLRVILVCFLVNVVLGEQDVRVVVLDEGGVVGEKYWNGEFYEFYGVPYAKAPTGKDRFQSPLPVEPWDGVIPAKTKNVRCFQSYATGEGEDPIVDGEEDCLLMNLLVPKIATEDNLVPVVVYIHSGAFSGGNGNMANYHNLARRDVIVISFNFRLGAIGFACLGNKEIPGNAALKDQVAALRWINKNIVKFGGDPKKVTVAGFSVGATMAELLTLSKTTDGLIDKVILDSGSSLAPFAINRDPVNTARSLAVALGFKDTGSLRDLTEFLLESTPEKLVSKGHNFFLPNSTFGFAPCVENILDGIEAFLTESPLDIITQGKSKQIAMLVGFANMEGLSRSIKFQDWSKKMNEKFDDFLPADLVFNDDKSKQGVIKKIKDRYFKGEKISDASKQGYVDYFSDSMFKYSILKSAKGHADNTVKPVYLYEFSYVGELNTKHYFWDTITGASHRDQTAYVLDFFGFTNKYKDLDTRDRMTWMWADFIKYEDPTAYESQLVGFKWQKYTNKDPNYLQIDADPKMSKLLFEDGYKFWNEVYEKYYWNPKAPKIVIEEPKPEKNIEPEIKESVGKTDSNKNTDEKIDRTLLEKPVKYEPKTNDKLADSDNIKETDERIEKLRKTVRINEPMKSRFSKENPAPNTNSVDPSEKSGASKTEL